MSRLIIVGDIHGCLKEFKQLLSIVDYNSSKDRLICLGDLVDRGPDSVGCVQYVKNFNIECVIGNHDEKFVRYHKHELKKKENPKYKNPMNLPVDREKTYKNLTEDDLKWLAQLPYKIYIKKHNMLLMHAGVLGHLNPLKQSNKTYIYCRYVDKNSGNMVKLNSDYSKPPNSVFWTKNYKYNFNIVYGHQVVSLNKPRIVENICGAKTYGIDTGCVYGGHLTAMIIEEDGKINFKQVKSSFKFKDFKLNDF